MCTTSPRSLPATSVGRSTGPWCSEGRPLFSIASRLAHCGDGQSHPRRSRTTSASRATECRPARRGDPHQGGSSYRHDTTPSTPRSPRSVSPRVAVVACGGRPLGFARLRPSAAPDSLRPSPGTHGKSLTPRSACAEETTVGRGALWKAQGPAELLAFPSAWGSRRHGDTQ